jgi:hypothetical protein
MLFYKVIDSCNGPTTLELQENGQLLIRSGRMRAHVPCIDDTGYHAVPTGKSQPAPERFVEMLKAVEPYISDDASRPWAMGAMFDGPSLYATNNVIFVQYWTGLNFKPGINVPGFAVREIIRTGLQPTLLQSDENSLTIHYEDGRWIKTQLYDTAWPMDVVERIFAEAPDDSQPLPEGFVDAVESVTRFVEDKSDPIYFINGTLSTKDHEGIGVSFEVPGLIDGPCFAAPVLKLIADADKVSLSSYPKPCLFYKNLMRGVAVGRMR